MYFSCFVLGANIVSRKEKEKSIERRKIKMTEDRDIYAGAKNLKNVVFSRIRIISEHSKDLAAQGKDIVFFTLGEPDFNTPELIKKETIKAIDENYSHYNYNRGIITLRKEIVKKISRETGVTYNPDTEIIVTSSGAEAINNALMAVLDEGDEVIIFTPAFMNYANVARLCGAIPVEIPLRKENGYQIDFDELQSKITDRTKLIVLNDPGNPSGVVCSREVLEKLAEVVINNNLLIFTDEMYNNLVYDGKKAVSIASVPGMKERTIMMNGFSKTYAMTGWRLGYIAADERMIPNILKVHQYSTTCSPTFIQEGLVHSMNMPETLEYVEKMVHEFEKRRNIVVEWMDKIPGLSYIKPQGAFYLLIDVSKTGLSGEEFASRLLEEKGVALIPGETFGADYVNYVRISYATAEDRVIEGMRRLKDFADNI